MSTTHTSAVNRWTRLSALVFASLLFQECFAQGLYNTAALHIDGNLYIDGEVINEGTVDNNGLVALTGDWSSRGSYTGKGVLEANGVSIQRINHHNQEVYDFVANGWGTKYIDGRLTVSNELTLMRGIVEISTGDALILKSRAKISGASAESYIDGPLTVSGTGYKFFPVGKNGIYAPIAFTHVGGEPAQYSVEVFENAPVITIEDVIVKRGLYWQRKDVSGVFGGSPIAVDFERAFFRNDDKIALLAGSSWAEPFAKITDVVYSNEATRISTHTAVFSPLILLGEPSREWDNADFYLSTALSPHAARTENRSARLFGERFTSDEFLFQVFNRWGSLVFETHSLEALTKKGWDGRQMNGNPLMSGVYPYRLTGIDKTGSKLEKRGFITIVY